MKLFHCKALDCYYLVEKELLVKVSPGYVIGIPYFLGELVFLVLFQIDGGGSSHQLVSMQSLAS